MKDRMTGAQRLAASALRGVVGAFVLSLLLGPSAAAAAGTYKWVDDKGVVHYTDHMPAEEVNKGSVQLSPQGIPVRKTEASTTAEQRKALETEREMAREAAKQKEEATRRDKALLDSYTVENDIELARNRAMRTVQAALQSALSYSAQLMRRRATLLEKRATLTGQGKPAPADVEAEFASIDAEVVRQGDLIAQKNKQLAEIAAKYDSDKERWHAIKGPNNDGRAVPVSAGAGPSSPATTVAPASVSVPAAAPAAAPKPAPTTTPASPARVSAAAGTKTAAALETRAPPSKR